MFLTPFFILAAKLLSFGLSFILGRIALILQNPLFFTSFLVSLQSETIIAFDI